MAQGFVAAVCRGRRRNDQHPVRAEPPIGRPGRADPDRPVLANARRADRRSRRGRRSCGNFGLLAEYNIDWTTTKPLSRVKEAHDVVRTLLDDGAITFDGEFFKYSGLFMFAGPGQEDVPVLIGAMRGRVVQAAGELSDGAITCRATPGGLRLRRRHIRIGAEKAGKRRLAPTSQPGSFRHRRGLGESEGRRPSDGPDLCLVHARRATGAQRLDPWSSSRSSTPSAPATSPRASS